MVSQSARKDLFIHPTKIVDHEMRFGFVQLIVWFGTRDRHEKVQIYWLLLSTSKFDDHNRSSTSFGFSSDDGDLDYGFT